MKLKERLVLNGAKYCLEDELKKQKLPLIMWGCGDVAEAVNQYLKEREISINGVYEDIQNSGNKVFDGMKVSSWEDVLNRYSEFNVILGHSAYEKGVELKKCSQVKEVFCLFSPHYNHDRFTEEMITNLLEEYQQTYDVLEDDKSRDCLTAYINTKLSGDNGYILSVFDKPMTFYHNDIFQVKPNMDYWDIGAYNGDTIAKFLEEAGNSYHYIVALEPDHNNYKELVRFVEERSLKDVLTLEMAAWNCCTSLNFTEGDKQLSGVEGAGQPGTIREIEADCIDALCENRPKLRMDLLKFNYFPGILEGLQGAAKSIVRFQPEMAITVGFDHRSVIDIVSCIKKLLPEYKLYLRFNHAMTSTLVLYATVK